MNGVSSTADLYQVLQKFEIPVLKEDGEARDLNDLLTDMFRAWNRCSRVSDSRLIADALDWLHKNGADFNDAQTLLLSVILSEQKEKDKKKAARESDKALDEFLASFRITGGDAL